MDLSELFSMESTEEDLMFFSVLYSTTTIVFAMAVLSKFLTNEFRFGVRSVLSLSLLFIGEPICLTFVQGTMGVVLFGMACLFVYTILPASHFKGDGKAVLITGCDSGFGHALAKKLDKSGCVVFAGCLHKTSPGAIDLKNACSERVKLLQMDVTDQEQVDEAFECVSAVVGDKGLWGLVNNAGIWYVAECDFMPHSIASEVMDVNYFGLMRVTQKFLPLVKKAKGRIVNVSSLAARISFPGLASYCASKAAVDSYNDSLRLEMKKYGVQVLTVQPSGYQTDALSASTLMNRREQTWSEMSMEGKNLCGRSYLERLYDNFNETRHKCSQDLTPVTRALKSALLSRRPLSRCAVGIGSSTFLTLIPLLPVSVADRLIQSLKPS